MPWIDDNKCNGCGICITECPVEAIKMQQDIAFIVMEECIRCALCHDICPQEAVMHDSEKVAERIQANIAETERNMQECVRYLNKAEEGQKCLERMIKHFIREKNIAEKTIAELQKMVT